MLEILKFIFSDIYHFIGIVVLIGTIGETVKYVVDAVVGKHE